MEGRGPEGGMELTEEHVERFVKRLEEWGRELPEQERMLLTLMIERSEGADARLFREPEGFGYRPRLPEDFPPTVDELIKEVLGPLVRDRNIFFDPRGWSTWDRSAPPGSTWIRS